MPAAHLLVAVHQPVLVVAVGPAVLVAVLPPLLQALDAAPAAPVAARPLPLGVLARAPDLAELAHALAEVDVDAPVVDQHALHLGVGGLGRRLVLVLDEGVLQAVARLLVTDHLARQDRAEPAEDELEVGVRRDRVQLAHEQDVLGRLDLGERQVAHHLEGEGLGARLGLAPLLLGRLLVDLLGQIGVVGDAHRGELGLGRRGRGAGRAQAGRVGVRVVEHHGVLDADVDQGVALLVGDGGVDLLEDVEALDDLGEDRGAAVEVVGVVAQGHDELAAGQAHLGVGRVRRRGHGDGAALGVLQLRVQGRGECLLGGAAEDPPDGRAAIGRRRCRAQRIAGLERKVLLDGMDGGEVVIFDFA